MPIARFQPREVASVDLEAPRPTQGPRLLSRQMAATYLSCSTDEIDRLVARGILTPVPLPSANPKKPCRRVLLDRVELDAFIDRCRQERR